MNFELFQIASSKCRDLDPIVAIIKHGIFPIVWIGIPILLIVFGTIDLGKAVIASDDKEVKQAQGRLIKRVIYAVAIFFVVSLVSLVMNIASRGVSADQSGLGRSNTSSWAACWKSI